MIKNKIVISLITVVTLSVTNSISYGDEISGSAALSNQSFENLTASGSLTFEDLTIAKDLIVSGAVSGSNLKAKKIIASGMLAAENIEAEDISVSGSAVMKKVNVKNDLKIDGALTGSDVTIIGKTKISGYMNVSESNFSDIEVRSKSTQLLNSKAHNILVLDSDNKQKLELKNSTVSGNITFESGKGEIYLDNDSKILGKVKGAKVIKE